MLEPPDLADELIIGAVQASYGIAVAALTFLPIGRDSLAWAYRARAADGTDYFLKVRGGRLNEAGLFVPRYLQDHGVAQVVAPMPARSHRLWTEAAGFALILYPFIDGATGMDGGMAERHWLACGAALRQIHATDVSPELARRLRRERFIPPWYEAAKRGDAELDRSDWTTASPAERELAAFWLGRRGEIRTLLERVDVLGQRMREQDPPLVLCHADIHTHNVLIDTEDRFWIVDWDEAVLAPKECDLMFAIGGLGARYVSAREEAWFLAGYGETEVDPLALAYYRYGRAVDDAGAFGEQVLLMPDASEVDKRDAVEGLMSLFAPGNIVDLAHAADRGEW